MTNLNKRNIAFIVEHSPIKGDYPFERIATIANLLKDEVDFSIFLNTTHNFVMNIFQENQLPVKQFSHFHELLHFLQMAKPDIIVLDGKDTLVEQVEQLKTYSQTVIHFDDFGEGAHLANYNFVSLIMETRENIPLNTIMETFSFAIPNSISTISETIDKKELSNPPHIVVCFEDGDANNLTYRTLRHLTQLNIPLQITVCIDHNYTHPIEELQMMVLLNRNTKLFQKENSLLYVLPSADIVICNANYTPYKVASIGIPCITAAQNERELNNNFPREENGFIHLGLGRKMKQSQIQNAVMEYLLHPQRRNRAIRKQQALNLLKNNQQLKSYLLNLIYNTEIISN